VAGGLEAPPAAPAHWFDDRARLVSPGYAGAKSEYLQQYLPLLLHAPVLIVTEPTPHIAVDLTREYP
jgi:hypothetical protein